MTVLIRVIDRNTGAPPVISAGDSYTFEVRYVEGAVVTDGITDEGDEFVYAHTDRPLSGSGPNEIAS